VGTTGACCNKANGDYPRQRASLIFYRLMLMGEKPPDTACSRKCYGGSDLTSGSAAGRARRAKGALLAPIG